MSNSPSLDFFFHPSAVWQARRTLAPHILRTPLIHSRALSRLTGCQIYLKMECWQVCGNFKVRGAINKVFSLTPEERQRGLVTTSSGNHAIAVAFAASLCGNPPATVFLPQNADPAKIARLREFDVRLEFHGKHYFEAYDRARQFCTDTGGSYVHSHADPYIIAGQGTVGLEILEDLPDVDAVLVPIGGGGLISGISTAVKSVRPEARIFGIEPTAAPSAYLSMQEGRLRDRIDIQPSIADGLLGGIGELPFEIIRRLVEKVVLLEDEEIGQALAVIQKEESLMIEAASVVGLAALLNGKITLPGLKVVLVLTSRNINAEKFNQIVNKYG